MCGSAAGQLAQVVVNTAAANRDPDVFHDPDRLDITRDDPPAMQTFGAAFTKATRRAPCQGELAHALTVITQCMPHPRRSGPAPWKPLTGITGPITLPIEFDGRN